MDCCAGCYDKAARRRRRGARGSHGALPLAASAHASGSWARAREREDTNKEDEEEEEEGVGEAGNARGSPPLHFRNHALLAS